MLHNHTKLGRDLLYSGAGLNRIDVIESKKKINNTENKKAGNSDSHIEEKLSNITETSRNIESFIPPQNHILSTPSRREGAASLQIAAIYQLQAFLLREEFETL